MLWRQQPSLKMEACSKVSKYGCSCKCILWVHNAVILTGCAAGYEMSSSFHWTVTLKMQSLRPTTSDVYWACNVNQWSHIHFQMQSIRIYFFLHQTWNFSTNLIVEVASKVINTTNTHVCLISRRRVVLSCSGRVANGINNNLFIFSQCTNMYK